MSDILFTQTCPSAALPPIKKRQNLDAEPIRGQSSPKLSPTTNQTIKTTTAPNRPTPSKRTTVSFPFVSISSRCMRMEGIISLGIALAMLIFSLSTTTAQPITTRNSAQDFDTLGVAGNKRPKGLWSDGTTMLVSDTDGKIYSYNLVSKERQDNHGIDSDDFVLSKGTNSTQKIASPYGIWGDGTTIWVASDENENSKLYAYSMQWVTTNSNPEPKGETQVDERYLTGTRDTSKDITLSFTNVVQPFLKDKTGEPTANQVTNAIGNLSPTGIWSDGTIMWVADQGDSITHTITNNLGKLRARFSSPDKIYAYNMWTTNSMGKRIFDGSRIHDETQDIDLSVERGSQGDYDYTIDKNAYAQGIWSDRVTMWVANTQGKDDPNEKRIYAYNLATKERDPSKDFKTLNDAENDRPRGIWSDGKTVWVADNTDNKIYAYHSYRKFASRNDNQDFNTLIAAGNVDPAGIWSDGATMWVSDRNDDKIYAYNLATQKRDHGKDINVRGLIPTTEDNDLYIQDIWSDGTTLWALEFGGWEGDNPKTTGHKIYAFNLSGRTRDTSEDFDTLDAAGNHVPRGLWSNETTMWVSDSQDGKIYAYHLSDAASLNDLNLMGHIPNNSESEDFEVRLTPSFKSGTTRYEASVPYAVTRLTVTSNILQANASVSISPEKDADTKTAGHQVDLSVGDNQVSITVTNTLTNSLPQTRIYTVNVKREFFTYNDPSKDISLTNLISANIRGLWLDDATMWVSGWEKEEESETNRIGKIYSYNLQTKSVSTNFLSADNADPRGLWSDKTTMWASDLNRGKIFAYTILDFTNSITANEFNLASTNKAPTGIWSDGKTMWVADASTFTNVNGTMYKKIFAYRMSGGDRGNRDENKDINLPKNSSPAGLWSDGATMWVADEEDAKLYAYKLMGNCREEGKDFNTLNDVGNTQPWGLWSNGTDMWVLDSGTKKLYAYNQPLSRNALLGRLSLSGVYYNDKDFSKEFASDEPNYSEARVVYSADSTTVDAKAQDPNAHIEIVPLDAKSDIPGHQIELTKPTTTIEIIVTAENGDVKQYKITIARYPRGRLPFKDFQLTNGNSDPVGIWSDRTNMWVLDSNGKKVYAYNMTANEWGSLDTNKVFNLEMDNTLPGDIWSDEITMWVTDAGDNRIYAYNMWTNSMGHIWTSEMEESERNFDGSRDNAKDFNTLITNLTDPNLRGVWSHGTAMWVVYDNDFSPDNKAKILAFNINGEKTRDSNKDITLDGNNNNPWGIYSNRTNMWVLDWHYDKDNNIYPKLYAYKMLGENRGDPDPGKNIQLDEGNQDPKGIWSDGEIMWVTDSKNDKIYVYNLLPPPPSDDVSHNSDDSEDSTLRVLKLSGIKLNPVFFPENRIYTALVDYTVASTTVTATPNDSNATVNIFSGTRGTTRSTASKGPHVALREGYNVIAIDVIAEKGNVQTYLVRVTKSEVPPPSGGPLPQSFQPLAVGGNPSALASSSSGNGWRIRLISAESLFGGEVRFVFIVPAEEFGLEASSSLLSRKWRLLPDGEFNVLREDNGDGRDRLTIILPSANEKQRFLRLMPQR